MFLIYHKFLFLFLKGAYHYCRRGCCFSHEHFYTATPWSFRSFPNEGFIEPFVNFQFHFIEKCLLYNVLMCPQATASVTDAPELAKMLYWLMVVGYSIRNIEVRFDMERVLGAPVKLAELPPGESI